MAEYYAQRASAGLLIAEATMAAADTADAGSRWPIELTVDIIRCILGLLCPSYIILIVALSFPLTVTAACFTDTDADADAVALLHRHRVGVVCVAFLIG